MNIVSSKCLRYFNAFLCARCKSPLVVNEKLGSNPTYSSERFSFPFLRSLPFTYNMGSVFGGIVAGGIIGNNGARAAVYAATRVAGRRKVKTELLKTALIAGTSVGAIAGAVSEDALLNNNNDHREE